MGTGYIQCLSAFRVTFYRPVNIISWGKQGSVAHWMDLGIWKEILRAISSFAVACLKLSFFASVSLSLTGITSPYQKYSLGIDVLSLCLFCTDRRAESRVFF